MIGSRLNDRYQLMEELGRGGLGIIYRAQDNLLDRAVAVKVLNPSGIGTEGKSRLLQEAKAVARLNHPNIVSIYDAGEAVISTESKPVQYIVMELIQGESLQDHKISSIDEVIGICTQVCTALDHAHQHGIVHRDLKPENVLITQDGIVKLTDFGLARSIASRITQDGTLIGTVFYIAPEMALGQQVDARADLYALGVMLYELTAGQLPFTAIDPVVVLSQHLHAPVIPPSTFNPKIYPQLEALILSLMSKQPEDRPSSALEVREVLMSMNPLQGSGQSLETPASPLERLAWGRLVGREREFDQVKNFWRAVVTSKSEQNALLITGESGVGKTPFIKEIISLAELSGAKVLSTACFPEGTAPYTPFAQVIREGLLQVRSALSKTAVADLLSLVPDLTDQITEVEPTQPGSAVGYQQRIFESITQLLTVTGSIQPVLVIFEDLQWADCGTLYTIRFIARRLRALHPQPRILMVLTYREADMDLNSCLQDVVMDLARERLFLHIKLEPFQLDQTRELLESIFQEDIPEGFSRKIHEITEGNFFFIDQICKSLIEEKLIDSEEGHWRFPDDLDVLTMPQSVRMTIKARINRLDEPVQDVLNIAAVIGREFDFGILQKVTGIEEDELIEILEKATRAQLVEEVKPSEGCMVKPGIELFAFTHGLIPQSLRENLSGLRLHRIHRRITNAIAELHPDDYDALAYHAENSGDEDRARQFTLLAADHSLAVFANDEAANYFQSALEMDLPPSERARSLYGLGEAYFRKSNIDRAIEKFKDAAALYITIGDFDQVARTYARRARAYWYLTNAADSLTVCLEGLAKVEELLTGARAQPPGSFQDHFPETPGMASLLHETGRAYRFNRKFTEAEEYCRKALALSKKLGLDEIEAETLATYAILPSTDFEDAFQMLTRAIDISESAGYLITAMRAHENISDRLIIQGDFVQARNHHLRGREIARRIGSDAWDVGQTFKAAALSLDIGDFEEVEDSINYLKSLEKRTANPGYVRLFHQLLEGQLLRYRGDFARAIEILSACQEQYHDHESIEYVYCIHIFLADALAEYGRNDEATQLLENLIEVVKDSAIVSHVGPLICLTRISINQGRIADARHLLEEARSGITFVTNQSDKIRMRWIEARLLAAERRSSESLAVFEEVYQAYRALHLRWYQAYAALDLARVKYHSDPGALKALDIALVEESEQIFQELKADYYADAAKRLLESIQT